MYLTFIEDWRGYKKGQVRVVPILTGRRALAAGVAVRVSRKRMYETAMYGPFDNAALRVGRPC